MDQAREREAFDEALARGTDQLKHGKLDQAQRNFRIALETEPENVRVLALLGLTYFRGNQFEEARPIYEHLVDRAPTDASHRMNLGLVYLKLNEGDMAISALEASRALDPSQSHAITYLGLAYARAGRYAEAYRSFLLAGQNEFAREIEVNLTAAERDGIHAQLGRTPLGPVEPGGPRTATPPRTTPPGAPPRSRPQEPTADAFAQQLSSPEISIERMTDDQPAVPMVPARSGASVIDPPRITDSMMFVLPKSDGAPEPVVGVSMISQAVAAAAPSATASAAERTKSGGIPPRPLSELATDELIRPEDGDDPFEITSGGALIIRIADRVMSRLDGVHVTGGDLAYDLATRRSRGHQTEERFDYGGTPLHVVTGNGYLIALPSAQLFHAVSLDDDILYLREDLVFAFESSLRWESGNVPGLRGKLPVVQFRGDGALVLRLTRPLVRVKLPAQGVVLVDADRLAGWIGRVIPRAVVPPGGGPMGATCIECTGEGIVLVEPGPATATASAVIATGAAPIVAVMPPPPPAQRAKPPTPPPGPAEKDETDMSSVDDDPASAGIPPEEEPAGEKDPEAAIDALDRLDEL